MENIVRIPAEMVKIIPIFEGDSRQLPLYIKKCEYIINAFSAGEAQGTYLFHVLTSRLAGEAANIVGERDNINTWQDLKSLLTQYFGDPRTEECLVMELESTKINRGENFSSFCQRVQNLRSILFAKIAETINDPNIRIAKMNIYNHMSLNVFLYNLPQYLVRLVRLRNVTTLEDALKIVLEEQNFQTVYEFKNNSPRNIRNQRISPQPQHNPQRSYTPQRSTFSPAFNNSFHNNSSNNSFQYKNNRNNIHHNDSFNLQNQRNNNQWQQSRSTPGPSQPPSQQYQNIARAGSSGVNTDVTMRTASSRRINYTDNNEQPIQPFEDVTSQSEPTSNMTQIENFHIQASDRSRKLN